MSAVAAGGRNNEKAAEAVRVVIISTQYIETDTVSFKSVVQRLTAAKHSHRYFHTNRKLPYRKPPTSTLRPPPSQSKMNSSSSPLVQSTGVSFSDLNRDPLPSWNELFQLCID